MLFHPDLRLAPYLPRVALDARKLAVVRRLAGPGSRRARLGAAVVAVAPGVSARVFHPPVPGRRPALLWAHGGGYVLGSARQDDHFCREVADRLGVTVASVDYRLAPEHPFPVPLEDCYAALRWLAAHPSVDAGRIAIGGASAGGGLAAALTLLAVERGEVHPAFQLLVYPMLDDRTVQRSDVDERGLRMWTQASNRFGWRSYLGPENAGGVPALAAPARYPDLGGLPGTWIGVGTSDLFHDEDLAYAARLRDAGVACELHVVEGAYHGFDAVERRAGISCSFRRAQIGALAAGLDTAGGDGLP